MDLKHTVKVEPVYDVDWHDFEQFVEKHLGFPYDFVQENEVGNDSTTSVKCPEVIDGYLKNEAEELMANTDKVWQPAETIMAALRLKGVVEPGVYLINECW